MSDSCIDSLHEHVENRIAASGAAADMRNRMSGRAAGRGASVTVPVDYQDVVNGVASATITLAVPHVPSKLDFTGVRHAHVCMYGPGTALGPSALAGHPSPFYLTGPFTAVVAAQDAPILLPKDLVCWMRLLWLRCTSCKSNCLGVRSSNACPSVVQLVSGS